MTDQSSNSRKCQQRRRFITSAFAGGAGALFASSALAHTNEADTPPLCGELSAADPLFIYQTLVPQLQISAIKKIRSDEIKVQDTLLTKLTELWTISERLKVTLFKQAKVQPAVERVNSLAYIGRTNAEAVKLSLKSKSPELTRAHVKAQEAITAEIVKVASDISQQGKTLTQDEWTLLQSLLAKIDDIKTIYQPAVLDARTVFDSGLKEINRQIMAIQAALMAASSSVVAGDKTEALRQLGFALDELANLPSPTAPDATATTVSASGTTGEQPGRQSENREDEVLTREKFIAMLTPIKDLINGKWRIPQVSQNGSAGFALKPVAFISSSAIVLPSGFVDPTTVRAIVRKYILAGTWWQVAGVTAACLPLWSAYNRSEHRKRLIYSALTALPRGPKSELWAAAYYLDQLTS